MFADASALGAGEHRLARSESVPDMPDPPTLISPASSLSAFDETEAELVPSIQAPSNGCVLPAMRERAAEALVALHEVERSRERPRLVLESPLPAYRGGTIHT
jgi:hypothetical protein